MWGRSFRLLALGCHSQVPQNARNVQGGDKCWQALCTAFRWGVLREVVPHTSFRLEDQGVPEIIWVSLDCDQNGVVPLKVEPVLPFERIGETLKS